MADVVSKEVRSRMMSGIRGKDTKPEVALRRALHARGFRFRLHRKDLPGRPDIVLAKHQAVIQVQGCFWHGHDCRFFRYPATNPEFWAEKIAQNRARDIRTNDALKASGWRVITVWECAMRLRPLDEITDLVSGWLLSNEDAADIS